MDDVMIRVHAFKLGMNPDSAPVLYLDENCISVASRLRPAVRRTGIARYLQARFLDQAMGVAQNEGV